MGDYPHLISDYYELDPYSWLSEDRKVIVLRYKWMTPIFKEKLIENIKKYKGKRYSIFFNKKHNTSFYCSQFIWYLYWKTANDLGFELDIDGDGGFLVFPFDLLKSPSLEQVIYRKRL